MSRYIDFQRIKQTVGCDRLLNDHGYLPVGEHAGYRLYHSPLRDGDANPSFSVTDKGRWRDFATGAGGDVIDLVIALGDATTKSSAAEYIVERYSVEDAIGDKMPAKNSSEQTVIERVIPLQSAALLKYLGSRGIPENVAKHFLDEVHYRTPGGNSYYGAGVANNKGGYAVRSPYFKGNVGPAGITILGQVAQGEVVVFEGFIDCLSWLVDTGGIEGDALILNSVANVPAAIEHLRKYNTVYSYLDRDEAGAKAMVRLRQEFPEKLVDESPTYDGFKDYNEFYINKLKK